MIPNQVSTFIIFIILYWSIVCHGKRAFMDDVRTLVAKHAEQYEL
jgi:hypothetical protein